MDCTLYPLRRVERGRDRSVDEEVNSLSSSELDDSSSYHPIDPKSSDDSVPEDYNSHDRSYLIRCNENIDDLNRMEHSKNIGESHEMYNYEKSRSANQTGSNCRDKENLNKCEYEVKNKIKGKRGLAKVFSSQKSSRNIKSKTRLREIEIDMQEDEDFDRRNNKEAINATKNQSFNEIISQSENENRKRHIRDKKKGNKKGKSIRFTTPTTTTNTTSDLNDTNSIVEEENFASGLQFISPEPEAETTRRIIKVSSYSWKTKGELLEIARKHGGMAIQYRAKYHSTKTPIKDQNSSIKIQQGDLCVQTRYMCASGSGGGSTFNFWTFRLPGNAKGPSTIYKSTRPVLMLEKQLVDNETFAPLFIIDENLSAWHWALVKEFVEGADPGTTPQQHFGDEGVMNRHEIQFNDGKQLAPGTSETWQYRMGPSSHKSKKSSSFQRHSNKPAIVETVKRRLWQPEDTENVEKTLEPKSDVKENAKTSKRSRDKHQHSHPVSQRRKSSEKEKRHSSSYDFISPTNAVLSHNDGRKRQAITAAQLDNKRHKPTNDHVPKKNKANNKGGSAESPREEIGDTLSFTVYDEHNLPLYFALVEGVGGGEEEKHESNCLPHRGRIIEVPGEVMPGNWVAEVQNSGDSSLSLSYQNLQNRRIVVRHESARCINGLDKIYYQDKLRHGYGVDGHDSSMRTGVLNEDGVTISVINPSFNREDNFIVQGILDESELFSIGPDDNDGDDERNKREIKQGKKHSNEEEKLSPFIASLTLATFDGFTSSSDAIHRADETSGQMLENCHQKTKTPCSINNCATAARSPTQLIPVGRKAPVGSKSTKAQYPSRKERIGVSFFPCAIPFDTNYWLFVAHDDGGRIVAVDIIFQNWMDYDSSSPQTENDFNLLKEKRILEHDMQFEGGDESVSEVDEKEILFRYYFDGFESQDVPVTDDDRVEVGLEISRHQVDRCTGEVDKDVNLADSTNYDLHTSTQAHGQNLPFDEIDDKQDAMSSYQEKGVQQPILASNQRRLSNDSKIRLDEMHKDKGMKDYYDENKRHDVQIDKNLIPQDRMFSGKNVTRQEERIVSSSAQTKMSANYNGAKKEDVMQHKPGVVCTEKIYVPKCKRSASHEINDENRKRQKNDVLTTTTTLHPQKINRHQEYHRTEYKVEGKVNDIVTPMLMATGRCSAVETIDSSILENKRHTTITWKELKFSTQHAENGINDRQTPTRKKYYIDMEDDFLTPKSSISTQPLLPMVTAENEQTEGDKETIRQEIVGVLERQSIIPSPPTLKMMSREEPIVLGLFDEFLNKPESDCSSVVISRNKVIPEKFSIRHQCRVKRLSIISSQKRIGTRKRCGFTFLCLIFATCLGVTEYPGRGKGMHGVQSKISPSRLSNFFADIKGKYDINTSVAKRSVFGNIYDFFYG